VSPREPARGPIQLFREGFPSPAGLDTAVSSVLLRRVSDGRAPEALRVHRPGAVVAFGPRDRHEPGYPAAVAAARARGFGAVERLAGGRAAVFHEATIAFSWVVPDPTPRRRIRERFDAIAGLMVAAFAGLGVDARSGAVPGEYCPGDHSVNARGRTKLMGVGQRLVQHAAHVGGVVVVGGAARVRDVLTPVYAALGLGWDPGTVGALSDEVPGLTWDRVASAIVEAFAEDRAIEPATLSADLIEEARALAPRFEPAA
jgi:octanoyl-[GcvH]:protein N-octanoyltransferase